MTIINKRLINYILIDKRLNEHFGQLSIDFWSLEITEIKFEIRNQLEIKLISKSRTRFQQVSDPSSFFLLNHKKQPCENTVVQVRLTAI